MQRGVTAALLTVMAAVVITASAAGTPEAGILPVFVTLIAVLWVRGDGVRGVGLRAPESWTRTVATAFVIGIAAQLVSILLANPLIERFTGTPIDLSAFDSLRGDLRALLTLLTMVWVMVVFVEEIVFRGFFVTELYRMLGPGRRAQTVALVLPAILFGLAHWYQGISGMMSTGLMALLLGYLFLRSGFNLWLPIMTHGFLNTAGLLLVYLNADRYLEAM